MGAGGEKELVVGPWDTKGGGKEACKKMERKNQGGGAENKGRRHWCPRLGESPLAIRSKTQNTRIWGEKPGRRLLLQGSLWEGRELHNQLMDLKRVRLTVARWGWRVGKARPCRVLWTMIRSLDFILKARKSHWEFQARGLHDHNEFWTNCRVKIPRRSRVDIVKPDRKVLQKYWSDEHGRWSKAWATSQTAWIWFLALSQVVGKMLNFLLPQLLLSEDRFCKYSLLPKLLLRSNAVIRIKRSKQCLARSEHSEHHPLL